MTSFVNLAKSEKYRTGHSRYRSTGVTHILRRISRTLVSDNEALVGSAGGAGCPECRFLVAGDRETRERAYRLAYQIYRGSELVGFDPAGMVVSPYDAGPETFTLLVEDDRGEDIATVSLVFDSEKGLPCDEIYSGELAPLRQSGRRVVEVTRLAVKRAHASSKELLLRMFNLLFIYGVRVRGCTDTVIEVNPRHGKYYEKMLLFDRIGGEKECPRVEGAPAVLLSLNLDVEVEAVKRVGGARARGEETGDRTLYPWFWAYEEEAAIAEHLELNYEPMDEDERATFGLAETEAAVEVGGEPVLAAM